MPRFRPLVFARVDGLASALIVLSLSGCGVEPPAPQAPPPPPPSKQEPEGPRAPVKFDVGAIPEPPAGSAEVVAELRKRLAEPEAAGFELRSFQTVRRFYEQREYQPAWTQASKISATGVDALRGLALLPAHGLDPSRYGTDALAPDGPEPDDVVAFELLLTDAWLTAAVHLHKGRVEPADLHTVWTADGREDGLVELLEAAVLEGSARQTLLDQAPPHPEYAALTKALGAHQGERSGQGLQEPWTQLPADLERWRWLPRDLGKRHVRVDLGARTIAVHDGSTVSVSMAVAASRRCNAIQSHDTIIRKIVLNPAEPERGSVDLRSDPNTAIHGAPPDEPFPANKSLRSGCLRPENPLTLAKALLRPSATWTDAAVDEAIATGQTETIAVGAIPVYITRSTVDLSGPQPVLREGAKAQNDTLLHRLEAGPEPIRTLHPPKSDDEPDAGRGSR